MNDFLSKHSFKANLDLIPGDIGKRRFGYCRQYDPGLTMLELMIVIVIIGILSSITIPIFLSSKEKAKLAAAISEIKLLEKMIYNYNIDYGSYPENLNDLSLKTLKDPWGNPYQYLKIEGRTRRGLGPLRKDRGMVPVNTDYDLYSIGKDGQSRTSFRPKVSHDDIVRANNGRYIGLVSEY